MNINVSLASNPPPGYTIIQSNQPSILASSPPTSTGLQPNQPSVSGGGDVHICGTCGSQYTEIKDFIDHKRQGCQGSGSIASAGGAVQPQMSHHGVHHGSHSSVVGMPVGMPHVILHAPSGPPQMYRIVLEPSTSSQGQSILAQALTGAQMPHIPAHQLQHPQTHSAHSPLQHQQENVTSIVETVTTSSETTNSSLIQLPSVGGGWQSHSNETDALTATVTIEEEVDSTGQRNVIGNTLGPPANTSSPRPMEVATARTDNSNNSTMHTEEEDVATFLATQLASQAAPQQNVSSGLVSEHLISSVVNGVEGTGPQLHYTSAPVQPHQQTQEMQISAHEHQQQQVVSFGSVVKSTTTSRKSTKGGVGGEQNQASVTTMKKNESGKEVPMIVVYDGVRKEKECPVKGCSFTTTHNKDLNRHIRKHTGEKPYRCDVCGTCFSRSDKLKVHTRIHTNVKPYWCQHPNCQYRSIDSGSLRKHMRTHTNERPYRCQLCTYSAKDRSQLTVHLRTHTGDTPFSCMYESCSAAFKTSSDLRRHERLHTGAKPYKCIICDYACTIKSNLTVHMKLNHFQGIKFGCPKCDFQGNSRKHLKDHEKSHASVLLHCEMCEHVSTSTTGLRQHMLVHSQEKPFQCRYCSFTCKTTGNLRYHVRNKHGCGIANLKRVNTGVNSRVRNAGNNNTPGRRTNKPTCYRRFRCSECGSGFVREDSWRSHMRQHQKHKLAQTLSGKEEKEVFSVVVKEDPLARVDQPAEACKESSGVESFTEVQPVPESSMSSVLPSPESVSGNTDTKENENSVNEYNSYVITIDGISTVFSNPVRIEEGNGIGEAEDQQTESVQVITGNLLTSDSKASNTEESYTINVDDKVASNIHQDYQLAAGKVDNSHHLYDLSAGEKLTQNPGTYVCQKDTHTTGEASTEYLHCSSLHQVPQTVLVEHKPEIEALVNDYQRHVGVSSKLPKTV
ncbi:zinc finger protein 64-like [Palaemon carinicauda]|uniref:zinc finger protein 64-like n=1 Tax=Palaemon carinicauda TaxID=392227 RepID=UPI0035B68F7A